RRRMAEGNGAHTRARPRRELRPAGAHELVEPSARQARQAADEKENLSAKRHRVCGRQRAALRDAAWRVAVLRAAGLAAASAPSVGFLLAARGRRRLPASAACRLFFSASMMSTTLLGSGTSGTAKVWPACLACSMATTASS